MLKVTVFITVAEFHPDAGSALPGTMISVQVRQTHTELRQSSPGGPTRTPRDGC